jgi:hypothetical protein
MIMPYVILQPHSATNDTDRYQVVLNADWVAHADSDRATPLPVYSEHDTYASAVEAQTAANPSMTPAQEQALRSLCERYGVAFDAEQFKPTFDLPSGYVAGWVGGDKLYVGCSPDGQISS